MSSYLMREEVSYVPTAVPHLVEGGSEVALMLIWEVLHAELSCTQSRQDIEVIYVNHYTAI